MGTILELNGIKKYYGKKEVLKGIGLQVEEGQVISVLLNYGKILMRFLYGISNSYYIR